MNSINKNFKYIYVIFMPNREKYIKEFFNRIKVNAIFIPAVNRDNLPPLSELLKDKIINIDHHEPHFCELVHNFLELHNDKITPPKNYRKIKFFIIIKRKYFR